MPAISSAFAGCSDAYVVVHLSGRACLDGRIHDGSPCLLNDESRAAEAQSLLAAPVAGGNAVVLDAAGRPVLASEARAAS